MKKRNKHIGSSLDDFLKEEGILEETRAIVLK
jgi:antitoxin HicB